MLNSYSVKVSFISLACALATWKDGPSFNDSSCTPGWVLVWPPMGGFLKFWAGFPEGSGLLSSDFTENHWGRWHASRLMQNDSTVNIGICIADCMFHAWTTSDNNLLFFNFLQWNTRIYIRYKPLEMPSVVGYILEKHQVIFRWD